MVVNKCHVLLSSIFLLCCHISHQEDCQTGFLKCYKCNSFENPNCAINPKANLSTITCKTKCDPCRTIIIEGITYRGCYSDFDKDISYSNYDFNCSNSLCNMDDISQRLQCYQCSGSDCINPLKAEPPLQMKPCLYYKANDRCYTDIIDEIDAVRGCESDENYTYGPFTQFCNTNGCNNQIGLNILSCITCSSTNSSHNRGCKRPPLIYESTNINQTCKIYEKNTCSINQLLGRPEETCFIYHNLDTVIRGCTAFSNLLQIEDNFQICKGNLCNANCLKPIQCHVCDSRNSSNCMSTDIKNDYLRNCTSEDSSCHYCELEDESIIRGCGKPKYEDQCYQCQNANGCNSLTPQKCYNCTSIFDPNCSSLANTDGILQQICPIPNDSCVAFIDKNGYTRRGCLNNQKSFCDQKSFCEECNDDLCNSYILPKNRLKCHQCIGSRENGIDDPCLGQQLSNPFPCSKYNNSDGCFAYIDNTNGQILRGCFSDVKEFSKCKLLGNQCFQCNDKSGCNNIPLIGESSQLSCIKCNSTLYDEKSTCSYVQNETDSIQCKISKNTPFYEEQNCFACVINNQKIFRGCSLDKDVDINGTENKCVLCNDKDNCNFEAYKNQSCLTCSSQFSNDCINPINDTIETKHCPRENLTHNRRGCYVKRYGGYVVRGCAVSLSLNELNNCHKSPMCKYCDENNCNVMSINSGTKVQLLHLLIFMSTVSGMCFKRLRSA